MPTALQRDVNEVPMPVLPWGTTQTIENEYATESKTASRITAGVRLVTLYSPDADSSVIRFKIDDQSSVSVSNADPNPVMAGRVVDVPVPADLQGSSGNGAGVAVISDDDVTVYVIERS